MFYCNLVIKKCVSLGLSNFVVLMLEWKKLKNLCLYVLTTKRQLLFKPH